MCLRVDGDLEWCLHGEVKIPGAWAPSSCTNLESCMTLRILHTPNLRTRLLPRSNAGDLFSALTTSAVTPALFDRKPASLSAAAVMGAWGYGLFQSDHDYDTLSELGHEMGLTKLEEELQAAAKAAGKSKGEVNDIELSIYGGGSHPDIVRKHLDSGVLVDLIKVKEAKLLSIPSGSPDQELEYALRDPSYGYVLLGACAMTLGCQLPEPYIAMLKVVYTEGGLMPDALKQMRKALFGSGGYNNGEPYDFKSKNLIETANSREPSERKVNALGFVPMNVLSPGGFFNTGMGNSTDSAVMKELRNKLHSPGTCAGCSALCGQGGAALLQCVRCKDRRYCSVQCQKKHWKIHKKLCQAGKLGLMGV
ncbi:hypothetical protein OPT61_g6526 [Boeremia exigua]|uniref:Uncharacterized protein n=1 Tax=Boeremia exigua TaxID=749465 RepID=A0ACC2I5P3_9PLEO|nr:hypothetical protein OPT61_g6526 [Boeremia exigua]